ncbi:hypothetical protein F2Q69_00004352 [Brassica cretica]|uniref:Uncharacterized protein n=1 Tax=Brassica cretica TaxID=69181 RepID=A0A8S9P2F2_BRACR|nr:hypothetical protein F2Q69_00004352 [Brassica cretica]
MIHSDHSLHLASPGPRPAIGSLVQLLSACLCLILVKFQLSDSLNHVLDHDTLVFRSYDLAGASPRTMVHPDDPIQDRGCYKSPPLVMDSSSNPVVLTSCLKTKVSN